MDQERCPVPTSLNLASFHSAFNKFSFFIKLDLLLQIKPSLTYHRKLSNVFPSRKIQIQKTLSALHFPVATLRANFVHQNYSLLLLSTTDRAEKTSLFRLGKIRTITHLQFRPFHNLNQFEICFPN
jgi:hypothetical protein